MNIAIAKPAKKINDDDDDEGDPSSGA